MMASAFNKAVLTALLLVLVALPVSAAMAAPSTAQRLDLIERKLDGRGLVDILNRIEQ